MGQIRLDVVTKKFKDVVVLDNLSLEIQDREFFTFVGPSGCGKSTILNLIAGLESLHSGTIYFDGNPVNHLSPAERDVAMVFQSYALYPHMTAYENIAFPMVIRKMRRDIIDTEVRKTAKLLGIADVLDKLPKELSGGQRQRVALGRAIIRKPKAFLMDEPLSNLDARLRIEMRSELKRIHQELQATIVYVTHDQEEALVMSDRMAVLRQGRIQQCASPLEVYRKPANLFVAEFIGSPPMNFFEVEKIAEAPFLQAFMQQLPRKEIIVGIRPSEIQVQKARGQQSIAAQVILTELTGNDLWVWGTWSGIKIRGKAAVTESFQPGEEACFQIRPQSMHFFEKGSGLRIELH